MCSDKERIRPIKSKNFRAGELYLSGDLTKFYKGTNSTKGGQNIQIKGKETTKTSLSKQLRRDKICSKKFFKSTNECNRLANSKSPSRYKG